MDILVILHLESNIAYRVRGQSLLTAQFLLARGATQEMRQIRTRSVNRPNPGLSTDQQQRVKPVPFRGKGTTQLSAVWVNHNG